jgi:putative transcriptional regulator
MTVLLARAPAAIAIAIATAVVAGELRAPVAAQPIAVQFPQTDPAAGDFLIASRRLDDANFAETVVLLLEAGPDGALGIVVNRRTLVRVATVLPGIQAFAGRPDTLYWGGPVQPQSAVLLARLDQPPPGATTLVDGVSVVRTRAGIESLLANGVPDSSIRLFGGYAGWTAGQLEWEISTGSWQLRRADAESIFTGDPDTLWKSLSLLASAPVA